MELDDEAEADELEESDETKAFFKQLETEANVEEAGFPDEPDDADLDLRAVPDKAELKKIFKETVALESPIRDILEHKAESPEDIPKNLHHALWHLGPHAKDEEIFDALWRLTAYLRHYKGGCDRNFLKNPRITRRRCSELNWYQFLGCILQHVHDFYFKINNQCAQRFSNHLNIVQQVSNMFF